MSNQTGKTGGASLPYKKLEKPPAPPLLTAALAFCLITGLGDPTAKDSSVILHGITWADHVGFTAAKMLNMLHTQQFVPLLQSLWQATAAETSIPIFAANALFVLIFGFEVEKKLKPLRYIAFLLTVWIGGWVLVLVNAGTLLDRVYIGPSMMLFGLLGGYFAFFPKRPFEPQQWVRPNTEIFRKQTPVSTTERYWVSPWLYVTAFAIYEILLQLCLSLGKDFIAEKTHMESLASLHDTLFQKMLNNPYAFQPVAAIMAIGLGYGAALILPKITARVRTQRPGGKLQLEVLQHYKELRTLDMTHDQACEGAARFAAVPIEIARDWISKGAAGLKDQDLR